MYEALQIIFAVVMVSSLVALVVKGWHHPQRTALVARFWSDVYLFKSNILRIGLAVFFIVYVQGVIGRTLAFFLHHRMAEYVQANATVSITPRLFDVGHEMTPDFSESTAIQVINEALQYIMFLALAGVFAVPYWLQLLRGRSAGVYTVNMVTRFLVTLACGHALRMCAYLVTSLPGPAAHCLAATDRQPTKLSDIFSSPRVGGNCGDLIFSGHMLTAVTIVCTSQLYVEKIFGRRQSLVFVLLFLPIVAWQVVNILMLRAHYSVDIVVAVEVGVGLNLVLSRLLWLTDAERTTAEDPRDKDETARPAVDVEASSEDSTSVRLYKEDSVPCTTTVVVIKTEGVDDSGADQLTTGDETFPNGVTPTASSSVCLSPTSPSL